MVRKLPDCYLWVSLGAALFTAGILKYWLIISGRVPFNADEAIVGLMARHILSGERPVFFYGQAYMGSLDAWLIAGAFKFFGEGVWAIRLVQACLYLVVLLSTVMLGKAAMGSWQAGIIAAWLLAVPVVNVTLYTTVSLGGYVEALLIGNLILLVAFLIAKIMRLGFYPGLWLWLSLGFLAGFGIWAFGLTLVYSLPACVWLAWNLIHLLPGANQPFKIRVREPVRLLFPPLLVMILGGLIGSIPWWIYAQRNGLAPLILELRGGNIAGVEELSGLGALGQHLFSLVLLGGSVTFGLRPPWEIRWLALPLLPLALTFWVGVLFFAVKKRGQFLLWAVILTLCLGFLLTPFGADPSGRYFLPLAVPLALFAAGFILFLNKRFRFPVWSLVALVLVFNLWGTLQSAYRSPPGLSTQFNVLTQVNPRSQEELIAFLRDHDIQRGYTNYWVAYPLAFLSGEELIFVPRLPYHTDFRYTSRDDRYAPYDRMVEAADSPAFITTHHPALDARLRQVFNQRGAEWKEAQVGDYQVFYDLSVKFSVDSLRAFNQLSDGQAQFGMGTQR